MKKIIQRFPADFENKFKIGTARWLSAVLVTGSVFFLFSCSSSNLVVNEPSQKERIVSPTGTGSSKAESVKRAEMVDFCGTSFAADATEIICEDTELSAPLSRFSNLETLVLNKTSIQDFTPVSKLTGLTSLVISGTPLKDINFVKSLTNLKSLSLVYTDISDISPVAHLLNLEELMLHNTKVVNISPVRSLIYLKTLSLGPKVKNILPLKNLKNLTELVLVGTKISKSQIRALKKALPDLKIIK
jgi:Leucine-rich repeat (LRR) protein